MTENPDSLADPSVRLVERRSPAREAAANESGLAALTVEQILAWADAHHAAHGAWPAVGPGTVSGVVSGAPGESWKAINHALALGLRGLAGDSSLAELLAEHRGAPLPDMGPKALAEKIWAWEKEQFPIKGPRSRRRVRDCPRLSIEEILAWADAHQAATGDWPGPKAGTVRAAPYDVSWGAIACALGQGHRGLPGGSSLFQLRKEYRDFRPPLTLEQVLAWADAHHEAVGTWPTYLSGKVPGAPGETWITLDLKLRDGGRGLPGGLSVARLLAEYRGIWHGHKIETLSVEQVLAWADAYHATHGRWPDYESGLVDPSRRETWCAINAALSVGRRGLPSGTSLVRLLIEHRGPEASNRPSRMSVEQVLAWADAHHAATGRWPHSQIGPVTEAPDITWAKIDGALFHGCRGLPGGLSVRQLLAQHRGLFNRGRVPRLTVDQIMAWVDAYQAAHHCWPTSDSGLIPGTHHETWIRIDKALAKGRRGLPSNMNLRRLIVQQRSGIIPPAGEHSGAPLPDMSPEALAEKIRAWKRENFPLRRPRRRAGTWPFCPSLTIGAILAWADAHHAATGNWPTNRTGRVHGAPSEMTWNKIQSALINGHCGLPGRQTLHSVFFEHRDVGGRRTPRALSVEQVLAWADDFRSKHGCWPNAASGSIAGAAGERWSAIECALQAGRYGLPGGTSLLRLIEKHRDPAVRQRCARLTVEQVLAWMDAHHASTGRWPTGQSGPVRNASPRLTWAAILRSLRDGHRGLPAGWSLARLRVAYREPRPELAVERIMAWADAHHAARGCWPTSRSGRIEETSRETWSIVNAHLTRGGRGLPGGQNLGRFLLEHRGARSKNCLPPLRVDQVLAWADAHHATRGAWPKGNGGQVDGAPGESWEMINRALKDGWRGLTGGTSLSRLLAEHRGHPARLPAPKLTVDQILAWADAHHEATGQWPTCRSGVINGTEGERWSYVCNALQRGNRGLSRSESLSELLFSRRQARRRAAPPRLTIEEILLWADEHHAAHGRWPTNMSGRVLGAPGESWGSIGWAVANGYRGLSGGTTLTQLLAAHRPTRPSALTLVTVQAWADAHQKATGFLPTTSSGPVLGTPGETWGSIDRTLHLGGRGLRGGATLAQLLGTSRHSSPPRPATPLTVEQIGIWAKRHHAITGQWPTALSGPIEGARGEEWSRIAKTLLRGGRGLSGGSSLAEFINRNLDPSVPTEKRKLTIEDILAWADAHHERTGRRPTLNAGSIPAEPGLTWIMINDALRKGYRGVGPGLSLARLYRQHRGSGPSPAAKDGHERS